MIRLRTFPIAFSSLSFIFCYGEGGLYLLLFGMLSEPFGETLFRIFIWALRAFEISAIE